MLPIFQVLLAVLFMAMFFYLQGVTRRYRNLPPGPIQLGFELNSLLKILTGVESCYECFQELGIKKYGPIIYSRIGWLDIVVLQDYDHIKEALIHKDWVDRIHSFDWFSQRSFGKILGIFACGGECWKEMRQFTMRTLREFAFGKGRMEMLIQDEVKSFTEIISTRITTGEPTSIPMSGIFSIPTLSIILNLVIGDSAKIHDPHAISVLNAADEGIKQFAFSTPNALTFHMISPKLAKFLAYFSSTIRGDAFREGHENAQKIFREIIEECRAVGAYKTEPRSFVDVFLKEMEANQVKNGNPYYTEEQLIVVLMDLVLAGTGTMSNTIEFAILYMALHPSVQAKVHAEIDEVIGSSRLPAYEDKSMLPYTQATILEIHRRCTIVPFFPLTPTQDSKIGKYFIPKGTIGLINLYAMNMDANTWSEPFEFRPERFLDANQKVINANKLLTFGAGRRSCYGESLSSTTIFLFVVTLIQRFTFKLSAEHPRPTMKAVYGLTLSPEPFHCIIQERC